MSADLHIAGRGPVDEELPATLRRVRAVRIRSTPTAPAVVQAFGGIAFLAGLFVCVAVWSVPLAIGVTLAVAGAAAIVLGALREADRI